MFELALTASTTTITDVLRSMEISTLHARAFIEQSGTSGRTLSLNASAIASLL